MLMRILICIFAFGFSSVRGQNCPWDWPDLELWSNPATWKDGLVPSDGSSFDITKKILLDVETASLGTNFYILISTCIFTYLFCDIFKLCTFRDNQIIEWRNGHIQSKSSSKVNSRQCSDQVQWFVNYWHS